MSSDEAPDVTPGEGPREKVPDSELGTAIEGANTVWNDEADEVRLYRDGDTLKFRPVTLGDAETW